MGKRFERHLLNCFCGIVTGDKGSGKSTLFAYILDVYKRAGYDVYCQYPYKDCYQIPLVETKVNGITRIDVDKQWLYSANLSHSCILLDEIKTIWPARSYAKWTASDEDFFNFLRKDDIHLFGATQAYDGIDLNVRRASDETYYLTLGFWHFTHIEASHTTLCKVADKNTEVEGRMFKKGMRKVAWDICEVPSGNFLFWRRKWYNKFVSTHTFYDKPFKEVPKWDDIIDFKTLQDEQGYIDSLTLKERIKEFYKQFITNDVEYIEFQEVEDDEDDNFLGVNLNEEFNLDFEPTKKLGFKERIRRARLSRQDTSDFITDTLTSEE